MQTAGRSLKRPCSAILHGPVKSLRLQRALQTSSPSSPGSSAENKLDDVDAKLNRLETILAELNADRRRNNDSGRRAQSHEQSATSDGSFTSGGRGSGQQNGSAIDTALGLAMGTVLLGLGGIGYFAWCVLENMWCRYRTSPLTSSILVRYKWNVLRKMEIAFEGADTDTPEISSLTDALIRRRL